MGGSFKIFDAYTLRARIFPALVANAAVIAALAIVVPWHRLSLTHAIASVAVPIILWVTADVARQAGRKLEGRLYEKWGGKPSTTMLRHSDTRLLDAETKELHLRFLGQKLDASPPTVAHEIANPAAADTFYERCGNWLRENTRDTKKYALLLAENITYGYRRNLYAVKPLAISANVLLLLAASGYAFYVRPQFDSEVAFKITLIGIVAIAHTLFMWLLVTEKSVRDAADGYGRQLFLCCETLNTTKPRRAPAKK